MSGIGAYSTAMKPLQGKIAVVAGASRGAEHRTLALDKDGGLIVDITGNLYADPSAYREQILYDFDPKDNKLE
jgi:hypothetical protein